MKYIIPIFFIVILLTVSVYAYQTDKENQINSGYQRYLDFVEEMRGEDDPPFVKTSQKYITGIKEGICHNGYVTDCLFFSSMKLRALTEAGYNVTNSRWWSHDPDKPGHMVTVVFYEDDEYFLTNYGNIITREELEKKYYFVSYNGAEDYFSWLRKC